MVPPKCTNCGGALDVGRRQARRISNGMSGSRCTPCRGRPEPIQASDSDHRYWLGRFGVEVPRGVRALDALRASAVVLPRELADLALEFDSDFRDLA